MRDVICLLFNLLTTLAKLLPPGGGRAVIAENLLLKQQLIIHSRSRQRAPNLSNEAISGKGWPTYISSDNDPLFQYHRWKANLRVLEINEIKSLPHVPMSHPFTERLIGSVRRELLDQTLFWTATDLENKLQDYQSYYNNCQTHSGCDGATPVDSGSENIVALNEYRWKKYCRGLFQFTVAA